MIIKADGKHKQFFWDSTMGLFPNYSRFFFYLLILEMTLSACKSTESVSNPTQIFVFPTSTRSISIPTNLPTDQPTIQPTLPSTPKPTNKPIKETPPSDIKIWISLDLETAFQINPDLPPGFIYVPDQTRADIQVKIGQGQSLGLWVYVVVTAFPSLRDDLGFQDLKDAWSNGSIDKIGGKPLLMSQETANILTLLMGPSNPEGIKVLSDQDALAEAWEDRSSLAILPFDSLEPRWKVLLLDGQSPLQKSFDFKRYPLTVPIRYETVPALSRKSLPSELTDFYTNFNPDRLTNITLTGVTALVRGTALTMEAKGLTYPAIDIRSDLLQADILHISNEIPFYSDCPPPELYPSEIRFCSPPEYIQLLEDIGTDIIELDGDHFGDYGVQAMQETLELYQERNWPYYGGGSTYSEGRMPVFLTHNGNKFAFIGCNAKGISYYASADETTPGAVECDFDWLANEISNLKEEGYLVIATFQHNEYYTYQAQPDLIRDFQRVAQAGAIIVSGSQAHQSHGMEFFQDCFIHYGLGNLFFDQYRYLPGPELDRAFIDRHFFYNQRYISTELLTIKFIDLARSRPTTREERDQFLTDIFTASGWR